MSSLTHGRSPFQPWPRRTRAGWMTITSLMTPPPLPRPGCRDSQSGGSTPRAISVSTPPSTRYHVPAARPVHRAAQDNSSAPPRPMAQTEPDRTSCQRSVADMYAPDTAVLTSALSTPAMRSAAPRRPEQSPPTGMTGRWQPAVATPRSANSAGTARGSAMHRRPRRAAGRRAFSLTFSVTQRDAVYRRSPILTVASVQRDRSGGRSRARGPSMLRTNAGHCWLDPA